MAGPYYSSKRRAGVEPVRSESREGDSQTVSVGMEGMQGIEAMLRSVLEAQEKLAHQVGELAQKVEGMEQKVEGVEQQQGQIMQKVEGLEMKADEVPQMVQNMKELTGRVRCMDWQRLRWRRVEWERIPPDMRVMVIPFLGVRDIMSLNSAISGKRLRKQLKKSYRGAVIPAFDQHRFTEKGGFKGLRWVMKAEVCLQRCEVVVHEEAGGVIEDAGKVLRWLVDNEHGEVAAVHAMKSDAEDVCQYNDDWDEEMTTLWVAALQGYVDVVRALLGRGADIERGARSGNGCTPLFVASQSLVIWMRRGLCGGRSRHQQGC